MNEQKLIAALLQQRDSYDKIREVLIPDDLSAESNLILGFIDDISEWHKQRLHLKPSQAEETLSELSYLVSTIASWPSSILRAQKTLRVLESTSETLLETIFPKRMFAWN